MSTYLTEEEQLKEIKKWWNKYGNIIVWILSIVLFCCAGYKYMYWHKTKMTQQASITYEQMMNALSNQDTKAVRSYAQELIKEYNKSVYSDIAHLTLAKINSSKNRLDLAEQDLRQVMMQGNMIPLKQIARIRLARLLAGKKSFTEALNELSTIEDTTYLPVINELKGDIYNAAGKYPDAMNSYHLALQEVKSNGMNNLFLEMKKNDLALKIKPNPTV